MYNFKGISYENENWNFVCHLTGMTLVNFWLYHESSMYCFTNKEKLGTSSFYITNLQTTNMVVLLAYYFNNYAHMH